MVHDAWRNGGFEIISKVNNVREESLVFNRQVFGNIFKRKRELENRLKGGSREA